MIAQMTGHMVPLDVLNAAGLSNFRERLRDLVRKVRELGLDENEYVCLKYIVLLNPGKCRGKVVLHVMASLH